MMGLTRLPGTKWLPATAPKLHRKPLPKRHLCHLTDLDTWSSCTAPLQGIVIRDTYPDRVEYQCLVTTDLTLTPRQIHAYSRDRWAIEESFMDLTLYWGLDHLGSCRLTVATAQMHFIFLAYTLLHLFAHQQRLASGAQTPTPRLLPGREITAYWGDHYAVLLPSQLISIILDNYQAWLANRDQLIAALRYCEGLPPPASSP